MCILARIVSKFIGSDGFSQISVAFWHGFVTNTLRTCQIGRVIFQGEGGPGNKTNVSKIYFKNGRLWNAQLLHRCKSTEHILDAGVEGTASDWLENSGITQFVPQFLPAPLARLFVLLPALGEQIIPSVLVANR